MAKFVSNFTLQPLAAQFFLVLKPAHKLTWKPRLHHHLAFHLVMSYSNSTMAAQVPLAKKEPSMAGFSPLKLWGGRDRTGVVIPSDVGGCCWNMLEPTNSSTVYDAKVPWAPVIIQMLAGHEILEQKTPKTKKRHWVLCLHSHSYQNIQTQREFSDPKSILEAHQTCQRRNSTMPLHPLLLPNSTPGPPPTLWVWAKQRGQEAQSYRENLQMAWHTINLPPSHAIASLQKKTLQKTCVFPASKWF